MSELSRTSPGPAPHPAWVRVARGLAVDVLDLVVPVDCPGCGATTGAPCVECARRLLQAAPTCVHTETLAGTPVVAAARYADPRIRAMLIAHKERGRRGLVTPLAHALARAVVVAVDLAAPPVAPTVARPLVLVPVPSARAAVRARGQDSVAMVARRAAKVLTDDGVPAVSAQWLVHRRAVRDQVGLSGRERHRNLHGAFAVRGSRGLTLWSPEATVVVVDDVTTSGATLSEGLRALRTSGLRVVAAATLASARGSVVAQTQ